MKPHPKPVKLYGDGFIGSGFPAEVQQMSAACNVAVQVDSLLSPGRLPELGMDGLPHSQAGSANR